MKAPYNPFTASLMHYPERAWDGVIGSGRTSEPTWVDVDPFMADLTFTGFQRGRSAAYAIWQKQYDVSTYPMFLTDLEALILSGKMSLTVSGLWLVKKRGQNYGIRLTET